jgi:hypothetical protein
VCVYGPIHLFGKNYLPFYKSIGKLCKKFFDEVSGTYPDFWNKKETPKKFYRRSYESVVESDLAVDKKIPVIAVAKKGLKISKMVLGLPNLMKIVRYTSIKDANKKLEKELKVFGKRVERKN